MVEENYLQKLAPLYINGSLVIQQLSTFLPIFYQDIFKPAITYRPHAPAAPSYTYFHCQKTYKPMTAAIKKPRIESIDILRGIVMIIMALDHVRDYFHVAANTADPLDVVHYSLPLYFTRWITHFCAPIFIFLSGTSVYLQSFRKTKKELAVFVIKRGAWLILVEWTIMSFAWSFNPYFTIFPLLSIITTIGISMVILGLLLLIKLPYQLLFAIGAIIVLGHNALDFWEADPGFKPGFFWDLFHSGVFKFYPWSDKHALMMVYPFPAWTGLMLLGYCTGKLFEATVSSEVRTAWLRKIGLALLIAFVVIRFTNLYGDPMRWSSQHSFIQTVLSFLKVNKYPPSLLYLCITIGTGLIALSYLENVKNKFTAIMKTYGRTAFFYYILHIYFIHIIAVAFYFIHGHHMSEVWNIGKQFPFLFVVPGQGESLLVVYIIWIALVAALYPLCKWYDGYKTSHKEKWWLSYL